MFLTTQNIKGGPKAKLLANVHCDFHSGRMGQFIGYAPGDIKKGEKLILAYDAVDELLQRFQYTDRKFKWLRRLFFS